jgi:hypothetical protein
MSVENIPHPVWNPVGDDMSVSVSGMSQKAYLVVIGSFYFRRTNKRK